jgi:hypothetical protein
MNRAFFIDLTERPPRSFRVRLGGFVILARMIDKGRANIPKPVKTSKPGSKPLSSMTMPALEESRKSRAAA